MWFKINKCKRSILAMISRGDFAAEQMRNAEAASIYRSALLSLSECYDVNIDIMIVNALVSSLKATGNLREARSVLCDAAQRLPRGTELVYCPSDEGLRPTVTT